MSSKIKIKHTVDEKFIVAIAKLTKINGGGGWQEQLERFKRSR